MTAFARWRLIAVALLALVAANACSGRGTQSTTGGERLPAKRVIVGWGFQVEGDQTEVFLATTDETDKQTSHPVGRYRGRCERIAPAAEMSALTGASCGSGEGTTELHAVVQGNQILVLQMVTPPGGTADPMAREQVKQIGFPLGAAVEVAP
jgi:hypothetical protein